MHFSPPPDAAPPSAKLAPLASHDRDRVLPSLSSVTADAMLDQHFAPPPPPPLPPGPPSHWPSLKGPMAYRQPPPPPSPRHPDSPAAMDLDASSVASAASGPDAAPPNGLSIDDPDVRLAAEALGDLRAGMPPPPPASPSLALAAR